MLLKTGLEGAEDFGCEEHLTLTILVLTPRGSFMILYDNMLNT